MPGSICAGWLGAAAAPGRLQEVDTIARAFDRNGDGNIDSDEFTRAIALQQEKIRARTRGPCRRRRTIGRCGSAVVSAARIDLVRAVGCAGERAGGPR